MIDQVKGGAAVETDWTGTIATGSVQWDLGNGAAEGTKAKVEAVQNELIAGTRKVFDVSTFTVKATAIQKDLIENEFSFSPITAFTLDNATVGHITSLTVSGQEVIKTAGTIKYLDESFVRSAPYFQMIIEGIEII